MRALEWGKVKGVVRDKIVPVLVLLQATESHLGSGDVLLWVLQVLELLWISEASCCSPQLMLGYIPECPRPT
jgi:hypothetical protein